MENPDQNTMPVLLCRCDADEAAAERIGRLLEDNGIPCTGEEKSVPFYTWDGLEIAAETMDCGCVLVLMSRQAEANSRVDCAIHAALEYDIPLAFVYLEDCVFTALPVDNADRIHVSDARDPGTLLQYLKQVCGGAAVAYEPESFGSEAVRKRVQDLENSDAAGAFCFGPVPIVSHILILTIAIILAILFKNSIGEIVSDVLQKIGPGFFVP